jgi:hypothetical protein
MTDIAPDLVQVHLDLPNHWWFKGESIWAKSLGNDLYEIQNIPFCAYGLNCGDVVRAIADSPDLKPEVRAVVSKSGNQTVRISFCDKLSKEDQTLHLGALQAMGAEVERANAQFVCINVPPDVSHQSLCKRLAELEAEGVLEYETCEERVPGSFDDRPGEEEEDEA